MDKLIIVWFWATPLIFLLSLLLLNLYWEERAIRLAGLFSVLPGINLTIVVLIPLQVEFRETVFVSAVIDLIFIIPIVFLLRDLYIKRLAVPWLLLTFEILRSFSLILYGLNARPYLPFFEIIIFYFYYFFNFSVLLYCALTRKKSKELYQTTIK